jgi:hypothetical protein
MSPCGRSRGSRLPSRNRIREMTLLKGKDGFDAETLLDPHLSGEGGVGQVEVLHVPVEAAGERRVLRGVLGVDAGEVRLGRPAPLARRRRQKR